MQSSTSYILNLASRLKHQLSPEILPPGRPAYRVFWMEGCNVPARSIIVAAMLLQPRKQFYAGKTKQTTDCIWHYIHTYLHGGSSACPCARRRRLIAGTSWSLHPAQLFTIQCSYRSYELKEASELKMVPLRETCLRIEVRGCAEVGLFVVVYSPVYRLSTTTWQRENRFAGKKMKICSPAIYTTLHFMLLGLTDTKWFILLPCEKRCDVWCSIGFGASPRLD